MKVGDPLPELPLKREEDKYLIFPEVGCHEEEIVMDIVTGESKNHGTHMERERGPVSTKLLHVAETRDIR